MMVENPNSRRKCEGCCSGLLLRRTILGCLLAAGAAGCAAGGTSGTGMHYGGTAGTGITKGASTFAIRGRVTDSRGSALAGVQGTAATSYGSSRFTTDAKGYYSVSVTRGKVEPITIQLRHRGAEGSFELKPFFGVSEEQKNFSIDAQGRVTER